jgi:serine/threonine protein kinase
MNHEAFRSVSPLGRKFVADLLQVDYKIRMRSDEVLDHPWLSSLNNKDGPNFTGIVEKSQKAIANMVKMSNSSELKRAGSMAMVFGFQPRQAVEMRAIFQSFDTDASGALSMGTLLFLAVVVGDCFNVVYS